MLWKHDILLALRCCRSSIFSAFRSFCSPQLFPDGFSVKGCPDLRHALTGLASHILSLTRWASLAQGLCTRLTIPAYYYGLGSTYHSLIVQTMVWIIVLDNGVNYRPGQWCELSSRIMVWIIVPDNGVNYRPGQWCESSSQSIVWMIFTDNSVNDLHRQ